MGRRLTSSMKRLVIGIASLCIVSWAHAAASPLSGPVDDDVACDVEMVENVNSAQLHSLLMELSNSTFFRLFKVKMDDTCPFWGDKPAAECSGPDPSASTFNDWGGISSSTPFEAKSPVGETLCSLENAADAHSMTDEVDHTMSMKEDVLKQSFPDNCEDDQMGTFWVDLCEEISTDTKDYVNLQLNPERYTGYNGSHIWASIYNENCLNIVDVTEDVCYEERVLYRLLSGMHASTTIHISLKYKPPNKKLGRLTWESNPEYFMQQLGSHPERIKNLHFSFVVMLRALKKASPHLYNYDFSTGDEAEDMRTKFLVQRLLDSSILQSCSSVFNAFDESLLFQNEISITESNSVNASSLLTLKSNFKGVFHNISTILDCVTCQKCKLHGKLTLLGLGTALKTLLVPDYLLSTTLSRNEIVAFVNTLVSFSDAIQGVGVLTSLYWSKEDQTSRLGAIPPTASGTWTQPSFKPSPFPFVVPRTGGEVPPESFLSSPTATLKLSDRDTRFVLMNNALSLVAGLGESGDIGEDAEDALVELLLSHDTGLLALASAYSNSPKKFQRHALHLLGVLPGRGAIKQKADAIVVGAGLAGLTSTLRLLDRGATVVLMEKEHMLGGNSAKASSGINAYAAENEKDSLERFERDTTKSASSGAIPDLIKTLTSGSSAAISWLKERVGVDLSQKAQLGGHTAKRTYRPSNGMAGAEIIYWLGKKVREYETSGRLTVLVDSKVTRLITSSNADVIGVDFVKNNTAETLQAKHVVLTAGGFASDRSSESYLSQYRPELLSYPTTAGDWSTGDGIRLATALDADTLHMDKVQVHPTGFVDPLNPQATTKTLAAELLRGVGGILLDPSQNASRFCNELGTRQAVVDRMLAQWDLLGDKKQWPFTLLLGPEAAAKADRHVGLYTRKGLLREFSGGVKEVSAWMEVDERSLEKSIREYNLAAAEGKDGFGKEYFFNAPIDPRGQLFVGQVVPVLHYCMGGLKINERCEVLKTDGLPIRGLFAAGETVGGVHGFNRLAGNSLLECVVYGSIVGDTLPIQKPASTFSATSLQEVQAESNPVSPSRVISPEELAFHNLPEDCWVSIKGTVYDFTDFLEEHPAGAESILKLGGTEGGAAFFEVHNEGMLEDFEDSVMGIFEG